MQKRFGGMAVAVPLVLLSLVIAAALISWPPYQAHGRNRRTLQYLKRYYKAQKTAALPRVCRYLDVRGNGRDVFAITFTDPPAGSGQTPCWEVEYWDDKGDTPRLLSRRPSDAVQDKDIIAAYIGLEAYHNLPVLITEAREFPMSYGVAPDYRGVWHWLPPMWADAVGKRAGG